MATKDKDADTKTEKETGDKGGEDPNVDEAARNASALRETTNEAGEPAPSNVNSAPLEDPATKAHNDARAASAATRFGPDAVADPNQPEATPLNAVDEGADLTPHTISPASPIASQQPPLSLASDAP